MRFASQCLSTADSHIRNFILFKLTSFQLDYVTPISLSLPLSVSLHHTLWLSLSFYLAVKLCRRTDAVIMTASYDSCMLHLSVGWLPPTTIKICSEREREGEREGRGGACPAAWKENQVAAEVGFGQKIARSSSSSDNWPFVLPN